MRSTFASMRRGLGRLAVAVAVTFGLSAGCGGDDPMTDAFVGTWTYAGSLVPNCPGTPIDPLDLTGSTVEITSTGDSSLEVDLGGFCTVQFSVSGSTATARPGQSCDFTFMMQTFPVQITSWTLTLDGSSLDSSFSGSVIVCTVTGDGTLSQ